MREGMERHGNDDEELGAQCGRDGWSSSPCSSPPSRSGRLIPLGWVYIASKLSHSQFPSIGPYMIVIVGIIATVLVDAWLIGRLNDLYIRVTGTNRLVQTRPAWLQEHARHRPGPQLGDRGRGGDDVLGAARRRWP